MPLQLTAAQCDWVQAALQQVVLGARVKVFGSRATGVARPHSDLDLLVLEPPVLTWQQRAALADAFDAGPLPFRVDVVELSGLDGATRWRAWAEAVPLHAVHAG